MEKERYPIGRFAPITGATDADRRRWTDEIRAAPDALRSAVSGLDDSQLDTPYREGGWSVRQLVHHVAHVTALRARQGWS